MNSGIIITAWDPACLAQAKREKAACLAKHAAWETSSYGINLFSNTLVEGVAVDSKQVVAGCSSVPRDVDLLRWLP